jgi:hypothetical protein
MGLPDSLSGMIPEVDIWRVANLMLTRLGNEAMLRSAQRAHELASDGDCAGAATWLRITNAIASLRTGHRRGLVH